MPKMISIYRILFFFAMLISAGSLAAQNPINEKHIELALRNIGHQLLHDAGDSTSRVLPVEKREEDYLIRFENEFLLNTDAIITSVDSIVKETRLAKSYLVQMAECDSMAVVYSYAGGEGVDLSNTACRSREYHEGCFVMIFTIIEGNEPVVPAEGETADASAGLVDGGRFKENMNTIFFIVSLLILGSLTWYYLKRNRKMADNPNIIAIGEYAFNKRNMELKYKEDSVELTSKEADLLELLHSSVNETLERDHILNVVWGDEGDYVGRTLDVFISKLRKKLENDPQVKIANVRGVGYRLIIGE